MILQFADHLHSVLLLHLITKARAYQGHAQVVDFPLRNVSQMTTEAKCKSAYSARQYNTNSDKFRPNTHIVTNNAGYKVDEDGNRLYSDNHFIPVKHLKSQAGPATRGRPPFYVASFSERTKPPTGPSFPSRYRYQPSSFI